ncbi:DUF4258 domain-containing protein [Candidatus Poribacteria bacterium]|nr:DUF4258 domain-containing protein [Candidatus Poribacteria bacterium]
MSAYRLIFRMHAIRRMFQRAIAYEDVSHVLDNGETIEEYLSDRPYPSRLILGWSGGRALHVVVATNAVEQESIVITVYEPDPDKWEPGFRHRKPKT